MNLDFPEGATPLDPDESEGLIPELGTQGELNEFEALNISEGTRWASRSRKVKESLLTLDTLQAVHRRMFGKTWRWAGRFRKTQKSIGVESYRISTELRILCDDVCAWVEHETYPTLEIATRFHHRLVSIHPFPNGNGRHARLATDLLCERQGWPIPSWGSADLGATGEARSRYIAALQAADRHDYAPLIEFLVS